VPAPPDNGGGRDAPRRPGRNTYQQTTPAPTRITTIDGTESLARALHAARGA